MSLPERGEVWPVGPGFAAKTGLSTINSPNHQLAWDAWHFSGLNISHAPAGFGLPASLNHWTQMKSFGEPVHQFHDLLCWQVPGLFNNLIKRHRHVTKLLAPQPWLKSEAGTVRPCGFSL